MANKNIAKDGEKTRFSSTNQPANSGRRPSIFSKYIRENRVSLDDIRDLISSMLTYDADEIKAILENEVDKPPMGIILMFKAMIADMKNGDISNFEKLCDRAYGKPIQQHDLTGTRNNIPTDPKERRAIADTLRKELGIEQMLRSSVKTQLKKTMPKKEKNV